MKITDQKIFNLSTFILRHGLKLGADYMWDNDNQVFIFYTTIDRDGNIVPETVEPTLTAVRDALGY